MQEGTFITHHYDLSCGEPAVYTFGKPQQVQWLGEAVAPGTQQVQWLGEAVACMVHAPGTQSASQNHIIYMYQTWPNIWIPYAQGCDLS